LTGRITVRASIGLLALASLLPGRAQAQTTTVSMVKDINTTFLSGQEGNPTHMVRIGSKIYFRAKTTLSGEELWVTNGTELGTQLVKDISPGSSSSYIAEMTVVGTKIYFRATNGVDGIELWMSDGTGAGTAMVKDIHVGSGSSSPKHLCTMNGKLYFSANDNICGYELWQSDGTAENTTLLKDIIPGVSGSAPRGLTVSTNPTSNVSTLFFAAGTSSFPSYPTVLW